MLECPYCGFIGDECDFPDLFYTDCESSKEIIKQEIVSKRRLFLFAFSEVLLIRNIKDLKRVLKLFKTVVNYKDSK